MEIFLATGDGDDKNDEARAIANSSIAKSGSGYRVSGDWMLRSPRRQSAPPAEPSLSSDVCRFPFGIRSQETTATQLKLPWYIVQVPLRYDWFNDDGRRISQLARGWV